MNKVGECYQDPYTTHDIWPNGALILAIEPYTGRYTEYFTHVVKVWSSNKRGFAWFPVHEKDLWQ